VEGGKLDIGTTDTQSLNFEVLFRLNNHWSVSAGLPLMMRRYNGPAAHHPDDLDHPLDTEFVDDGEYHADFQDFHLQVNYLALSGALSVEPFITIGIPSHDYTYLGHAAVGQNLKRAGFGATFSYLPLLDDYYLSFSPSYVFVEETLGTSIDHWLVHLEAGYLLNERWAIRAFGILKEGHGKDFPSDFPPPRTDEWWSQHDRMLRNNYINLGVGVDWFINNEYALRFSGMTMVHADQTHIMKYTFSIGIDKFF